MVTEKDGNHNLELIQDFEMPTSCNVINMTKDYTHVILGGTYPPSIKCYNVRDLSMKFHRGLTCEIVSLEILSEDFLGRFFVGSSSFRS